MLHPAPLPFLQKLFAFLISLFLLWPQESYSKSSLPSHALSRFGKPKYPKDFTHFNYVNPQAPKGGILRLATIGTFDSLNNQIVRGIPAVGLALTLDPLLKCSPDDPHTWYCLIAEHIEADPHGKWVIFTLNPRATFHDGSPITPEDIIFSVDLYKTKGLPRFKNFYGKIHSLEKIGPNSVKITFKAQENGTYDKEMPMIMGNLRPLSKKFCQNFDFQNSGLKPLLGSGPYRIKEVAQGHEIVYERVKSYWAKDLPVNKGHYNFDSVQITYYKNDHTLREAFKAGEVYVHFETNQKKWETDYNFPAIKKGEIQKISLEHQCPVTVWTALFNMKNPLFEDRRVRQAIALAFDFEFYNRVHFRGAYKSMKSLFDNTYFTWAGKPTPEELALLNLYKEELHPDILEGKNYHIPALTTSLTKRQRLEKAHDLLREAGWFIARRGPYKGHLIHSQTQKPFTFTFFIKDPLLEGMVLTLKDQLRRLGITMEIRRLDTTHYEKRAVEKTFDMILSPWSNSLSPGIEQQYYFDPKAADRPGSTNYMGLKIPAIYALAKKLTEVSTTEELLVAVRALDRAVMGMAYFIPGFYDNWIRFAYWKKHVIFPPIDPLVGTNPLEWGWAPSASER